MKYFKRNGFVALVSMLSLAAYAEDILPLSVAGSETKEFIQASGYGIDTSNMIQQERIIQYAYLQPIITQYFIDNKSEIWLLFLIAHSKR